MKQTHRRVKNSWGCVVGAHLRDPYLAHVSSCNSLCPNNCSSISITPLCHSKSSKASESRTSCWWKYRITVSASLTIVRMGNSGWSKRRCSCSLVLRCNPSLSFLDLFSSSSAIRSVAEAAADSATESTRIVSPDGSFISGPGYTENNVVFSSAPLSVKTKLSVWHTIRDVSGTSQYGARPSSWVIGQAAMSTQRVSSSVSSYQARSSGRAPPWSHCC